MILINRLVILFLLTAFACSSPRDRLSSSALVTDRPSKQDWRVAVLDFETPPFTQRVEDGIERIRIKDGGVKLATAVAELLGKEAGYLILDRDFTNRKLQSHSLPTSGIPSSQQLKEMGEVLEVDGFVVGRCDGEYWANRYEWCQNIKASLWLLMVPNGRTAWSVEGEVFRVGTIGSDRDVIESLARDMVKKIINVSGQAQPPAGFSLLPAPAPAEREHTSPPLPSPTPSSLGEETGLKAAPEQIPDEFISLDALREAFSSPAIRGKGEPAFAHLNQYGYDLLIVWIQPSPDENITYSYAYFFNRSAGRWDIFDRSIQKGEEKLRNVYIDPETDLLIYVGEKGEIIRKTPLAEYRQVNGDR